MATHSRQSLLRCLIQQGFTPMHVAARCGRHSVLRVLLNAGVPVDYTSTPALITPLHLATGFSRIACVGELLERGADPGRKNNRGMTPIDIAGPLSPARSFDASGKSTLLANDEVCVDAECSKLRSVRYVGAMGRRNERVKQALLKAQAWRRKRDVVLTFTSLRRWKETSESAEPKLLATHGRGIKRTRPISDQKERRGPVRSLYTPDVAVFYQLCTHSNPSLMKHVVSFL